mgnify:CR=1 FL=1
MTFILIALNVVGVALAVLAGLVLYIYYAFRVAIYLDNRTNLPGPVSLLIGLLLAPLGVFADFASLD